MRTIITDAMDVQGGSAICMGPRNLLGRIYQAIPVAITVEGANILTRPLITFGQGAIRCHPYILKEMQAATEPDPTIASVNFDKALFGHIGFTISNALRALFLGLSGAAFVLTPGGKEKYFYKPAKIPSRCFYFITAIGISLMGGALKRMQTLSGSLASHIRLLHLSSPPLQPLIHKVQQTPHYHITQ